MTIRQFIRTQLCCDLGRFLLGVALIQQGFRLCCKGQRSRQIAIDQQFCQLLLRLLLGDRFLGLYRFRRCHGFFCRRWRGGGRGCRRSRLCRSSVVKTQGLHPEAGNGKDIVQRDIHLPVWQQHGQHRTHNIRLHRVAYKTSVGNSLQGNRFVDVWKQLLAHIKTQFHNAVIPFYSRFFRRANLYADGDTCLNKSILHLFCRIKGYCRHSAGCSLLFDFFCVLCELSLPRHGASKKAAGQAAEKLLALRPVHKAGVEIMRDRPGHGLLGITVSPSAIRKTIPSPIRA